MYLNLNPWTIGLQAPTTIGLIALAARHGFGGVDLLDDALQSPETAAAARQALAEAGLRWGLFGLPVDLSCADDDAFAAGLARLRERLPLVQAAGCTRTYAHLWPGSNSRPFADNFAWHRARIAEVAGLLGDYGVTLGLEFIGPQTLRDTFRYPFVHTLDGVLELADAVGPHVGLVLDFFHWYTSGGTLEALRRVPVSRLVNVHANDAVAGRPREAQQDLERALPLETGVIDARTLVAWLVGAGYDGPLIAEPFTPATTRFAALPADAVVAEVGACLRRLVAG
jgi:sugar phosphate isomerase/epimerase